MSLDLFIFVGETSGDVHGAALLKKIKELRPHLKIAAVAGPKMRSEGLELFMPMEKFQVMGYTAVFKRLPELIYLFKKTERYILKEQPKVVLFIDFPGFNLRMAKSLRRHGFKNKLIHYICPTVWAHGKKRVYTLSKTLDKLLSIFPFEDKYFSATSLKPTYVGHPLIEKALFKEKGSKEPFLIEKFQKGPLIGIFPGSRTHEIKQNLPKLLTSCSLFQQKNPHFLFALSVAEEKLKTLITQYILASKLKLDQTIVLVDSKHNFELMNQIHAAVATSGTITFELGAMKVPTVAVYHLSKINAFIARHIIKLRMPYYCIVNIICNKHIFPELYYLDFTPEKVAHALHEISIEGGYARENCLQGCHEMLTIMQSDELPSMLAAKEINALIHENTL